MLARDDVIHLVGDVADDVVTAILATGASYGEIEEAVKWTVGDAEDLGKTGRTLSPAVKAVCDLLASEPTFQPPARER